MESMFPDEATLTIIRAFESGELDDEMFSRAMDNHAYALAGLRPPLAGAA